MDKKQLQTTALQIARFLKERDNFLISAHINADGDAIASMIAVHLLLEKMGKKSIMVLSDAHKDERFSFLTHFDRILHYQEDFPYQDLLPSGKIEHAVICDVPGYGRLGAVSKLLPAKDRVVKIDHHPVEDVMGTIDWAVEQASSTAALVYEVIEQSGISLDKPLAEAVFTGMIYDTGRFSFSNTTYRDFEIAALMLQAGVKPADITNRIFFDNEFYALKVIGKGLYQLESHLSGLVNIIYLANHDLSDVEQNQIEELANYTVAVKGGQVGLFIREIKPQYHKISLRSKGAVDVNQVAKAFGGGGHTRAAGCRISGSKDQVIASLLAEIKKQL